MKEAFLHYIWETKQFSIPLITTDGEIVDVISSGSINHDAGPDFFNSKLSINDTTWVGNVEIHVKSSDWLKHKHQNDTAYSNLILHVVFENDAELKLKCPTIELKNFISTEIIDRYQAITNDNNNIHCRRLISNVDPFLIGWQIERMFVERLRRKTVYISDILKQQNENWNATMYVVLASSFGFKTNSLPFELLAKSITHTIIEKYHHSLVTLEAILFGQAGMLNVECNDMYYKTLQNIYIELKTQHNLIPLNPTVWKFSKTQPKNFPTIRIAQFARLLHNSPFLFATISETDNVAVIKNSLQVQLDSGYWITHYSFDHTSTTSDKSLGAKSVELIIINAIIPVIFAYNKHQNTEEECLDLIFDFYRTIKPECNHIVNSWIECGIRPKNGLQTQGLIELYNNHCLNKNCLNCHIGHKCLTAK